MGTEELIPKSVVIQELLDLADTLDEYGYFAAYDAVMSVKEYIEGLGE